LKAEGLRRIYVPAEDEAAAQEILGMRPSGTNEELAENET
jgi:hypothetical protein